MKKKARKAKQNNKKKTTYRVRNWSSYNKSLVQRGSITLWNQIKTLRTIDEEMGWNDVLKRESRETIAAEVIADMFLFWLVPSLGFNSTPIGEVRRSFSNGEVIPAPAIQGGGNLMRSDRTEVISAGFMGWAQAASCSLSNPEASNLPEMDYVPLINTGWCRTFDMI